MNINENVKNLWKNDEKMKKSSILLTTELSQDVYEG